MGDTGEILSRETFAFQVFCLGDCVGDCVELDVETVVNEQ